MAHSLSHAAAATISTTATATRTKKNTHLHLPSLEFNKVWGSHQSASDQPAHHEFIPRRSVTLGLAGAIFGLIITSDQSATAAARRPPPPPPTEKKDPNVSGVLAKVLASKKRKEAMKETISKLREKGKAINDGSSE